MMVKETNVKIPEDAEAPPPSPPSPPAPESQFNLDGILCELGSFGKYQVLLLLLLAFRDAFLAMCNFNYVFAAAEVNFRCVVPECEYDDSRFNASWTSFAIPNDTKMCFRQAPSIGSLNHTSRDEFPWEQDRCTPASFDLNSTIPCHKVIYEDYNSIVAEFDLGCQPWKRTLVGTVHNLGLIFSFVISGFISDRYGRKVVIVGTPLAVGAAGLAKSFSVNYWMLLVLEFLETAFGYGNASMVLSLETVSHQQRVVFSCMSDILASFGSAFFGLIAWKIPYWRSMMRAIYAPLLVAVFYMFLMDEGVRWLLAHDKRHEAVRVLNKVAKVNKITLSNKAKAMLTKITEEKTKAEKDGGGAGAGAGAGGRQPGDVPPLLRVLRSRTILCRVALMAACFFCAVFVFNGTIVNSTSISGNKYLNFSALLLVSVPTRVVTALTLDRFGRKRSICVAYMLCAFFFISSAFVPKSVWWSSVVFYLAGKMCSSYGIFSVNVVAMEVFPTTSRNSLTNIANTVGRLGAVVAPQAPLLDKYMTGLPSVLFGVVALGPALLALLLPDTGRAALPDHVSDAESMDQPRPSAAAAAAAAADPSVSPEAQVKQIKLPEKVEHTKISDEILEKSKIPEKVEKSKIPVTKLEHMKMMLEQTKTKLEQTKKTGTNLEDTKVLGIKIEHTKMPGMKVEHTQIREKA